MASDPNPRRQSSPTKPRARPLQSKKPLLSSNFSCLHSRIPRKRTPRRRKPRDLIPRHRSSQHQAFSVIWTRGITRVLRARHRYQRTLLQAQDHRLPALALETQGCCTTTHLPTGTLLPIETFQLPQLQEVLVNRSLHIFDSNSLLNQARRTWGLHQALATPRRFHQPMASSAKRVPVIRTRPGSDLPAMPLIETILDRLSKANPRSTASWKSSSGKFYDWSPSPTKALPVLADACWQESMSGFLGYFCLVTLNGNFPRYSFHRAMDHIFRSRMLDLLSMPFSHR